MPADYSPVFAALKPVLAVYADRLVVRKDTPREFMLVTKSPSPIPQHKGQAMLFGSVRLGKAYASFHLMPIYMSPNLQKKIEPGLKKRMQGKSCFNIKTEPTADLIDDLRQLTAFAFEESKEKHWI